MKMSTQKKMSSSGFKFHVKWMAVLFLTYLMLLPMAVAKDAADQNADKFMSELSERINELEHGKPISKNSILLDNPDGTKTIKYMFGRDRNYKNASGDYVPINTAIQHNANPQGLSILAAAPADPGASCRSTHPYQNTTNSIQSFFPGRFCEDSPVVFEIDGHQISFYTDSSSR